MTKENLFLSTNQRIRNKKGIEYWAREHSIHIVNDEGFQSFIKENEDNVWEIVKEIKSYFRKKQKKNLKITDRSLVVEVYAHIIPDKIADFLPPGIGNIIQDRTEIIDCGEEGYDQDRFLWDKIAELWKGRDRE